MAVPVCTPRCLSTCDHVEIRGPDYRGALKDGAKIFPVLPRNRDPARFVLAEARSTR